MERGEDGLPLSPYEMYKEWEQTGHGLYAAMGYQGLAMYANNPTLANSYLDASLSALKNHVSLYEEKGGHYPHGEAVLAKAMLNLAPLSNDVLVYKRISPRETIQNCYDNFIYDLGKQSRASKKLFQGSLKDNAIYEEHRRRLLPMLNRAAVLGLGLRITLDSIEDGWLILPAFFEPEEVMREEGLIQYWDANVYTTFKNEFKQDVLWKLCSIYVRHNHNSQHIPFKNPEISIVWVADDLALPGDDPRLVVFSIINELENMSNVKKDRVRQRAHNCYKRLMSERQEACQNGSGDCRAVH